MITHEKAAEIVIAAYPDSIVNSVMDAKAGYIVNIQPKNWNDNDVILDGFFRVDKRTGKLSEYSPVADVDEFKYALAHPVYLRNR